MMLEKPQIQNKYIYLFILTCFVFGCKEKKRDIYTERECTYITNLEFICEKKYQYADQMILRKFKKNTDFETIIDSSTTKIIDKGYGTSVGVRNYIFLYIDSIDTKFDYEIILVDSLGKIISNGDRFSNIEYVVYDTDELGEICSLDSYTKGDITYNTPSSFIIGDVPPLIVADTIGVVGSVP